MLANGEYHSRMNKPLPPSRTADQYVVRFPDGMRDRIAEAAKKNGRSMNAEIVARIEESFAGRRPLTEQAKEEILAAVDKRIEYYMEVAAEREAAKKKRPG